MTQKGKRDAGGYRLLSWERNPSVLKTGGKSTEKGMWKGLGKYEPLSWERTPGMLRTGEARRRRK